MLNDSFCKLIFDAKLRFAEKTGYVSLRRCVVARAAILPSRRSSLSNFLLKVRAVYQNTITKPLYEEGFCYGALEKTRTFTTWGHMHLKHARLPIPPPGLRLP